MMPGGQKEGNKGFINDLLTFWGANHLQSVPGLYEPLYLKKRFRLSGFYLHDRFFFCMFKY